MLHLIEFEYCSFNNSMRSLIFLIFLITLPTFVHLFLSLFVWLRTLTFITIFADCSTIFCLFVFRYLSDTWVYSYKEDTWALIDFLLDIDSGAVHVITIYYWNTILAGYATKFLSVKGQSSFLYPRAHFSILHHI